MKQLCVQEQYVKAASHLLALNRLYEAVDLLRSHRLFRFFLACTFARARCRRHSSAEVCVHQGGRGAGQSQAAPGGAPAGGALHQLGRHPGEGRTFLRSS